MTLQPTQIHDDGVGTAGRRTANPHVPDSIGNAEKKYGKQFCEATGEIKENHRNAVFPVIVRIKHAKQVKNRRKKTTRRLPDDISHVYAVQRMPQRENRRCL